MRNSASADPAPFRKSESCSVFTLQSHEILENWTWIEPFLERIDSPGWTAGDVQLDLMAANAQLWAFEIDGRIRGIWITKIENTPSGKRGLLWIAAGDPLEVGLRLYRVHTESWLRSKGCQWIEIIGRRGWKKVLPDYEEVATTFVKELT